jgi:hypothetical protein
MIDVGIMFKYGFKSGFGEEMHFRSRHLLFQASDHRGGKHNITNGTETDDEELWHLIITDYVSWLRSKWQRERGRNNKAKFYFGFLALKNTPISSSVIAFRHISLVNPPLRATQVPKYISWYPAFSCASGLIESLTFLFSA